MMRFRIRFGVRVLYCECTPGRLLLCVIIVAGVVMYAFFTGNPKRLRLIKPQEIIYNFQEIRKINTENTRPSSIVIRTRNKCHYDKL